MITVEYVQRVIFNDNIKDLKSHMYFINPISTGRILFVNHYSFSSFTYFRFNIILNILNFHILLFLTDFKVNFRVYS